MRQQTLKNQLALLKPCSLKVDFETAEALGKVFWRLMKHWKTTPLEQALLLGVKCHEEKLKEWQAQEFIPEDADKFARVGHLAGIHKNLRILFPYNREAVYRFMKTPQAFLNGKTPIQTIVEGGELNSYAYLAAIRRRLDQIRV